MVMIVRERRKEIGVIKAIGASNSTIIVQFGVEAVTFTVMGAIVGMVLAVIAGDPITRLLVSNSRSGGGTFARPGGGFGRHFVGAGHGLGGVFNNNITNIHAAIGWSIIAYGLGAAIIIALVGSSVIAVVISKVHPAEIMRTE